MHYSDYIFISSLLNSHPSQRKLEERSSFYTVVPPYLWIHFPQFQLSVVNCCREADDPPHDESAEGQ